MTSRLALAYRPLRPCPDIVGALGCIVGVYHCFARMAVYCSVIIFIHLLPLVSRIYVLFVALRFVFRW